MIIFRILMTLDRRSRTAKLFVRPPIYSPTPYHIHDPCSIRIFWIHPLEPPGGSRIIGYIAQSLLTMIDFGLDPQEAAILLHFQNRNGDTELEPSKPDVTSDYHLDSLREDLQAMNHTVDDTGGETSGLGNIDVMEN
jgi:Gamma-glutamyltranspeptidase